MELDDLYQDLILDHFKHPRNQRPLAEAEVLVDEENPTCGDHIRLMAKVEQGKIVDVKFEGKGCAISTASASMMSGRVSGWQWTPFSPAACMPAATLACRFELPRDPASASARCGARASAGERRGHAPVRQTAGGTGRRPPAACGGLRRTA